MSLSTGCTDELEFTRLLNQNRPSNFEQLFDLSLTEDGNDRMGLNRFLNDYFSQ